MLNKQDKADIIEALSLCKKHFCDTSDCKSQCRALIAKVAELYVGVPHSGGGQAMPDDHGPYDTKGEATEDLRGLIRFLKANS